MIIREVREEEREEFNAAANYPMQAWEWGEFRKSLGSEVIRLATFEENKLVRGFQIYSTKFPKTSKKVWLYVRGPLPNEEEFAAIKQSVENDAIFVKLEPGVAQIGGDATEKEREIREYFARKDCVEGKIFFAKDTIWIDLDKTEQELLSGMKEKTRYNVRLAQKHGVVVEEVNSDEAFEEHLKLMFGTTKRQGFVAHTPEYHKKLWSIISQSKGNDGLVGYLLQAKYQNQVLASWMLFKLNEVLYYPYGASSAEHRDVMASHAMMWAAIELGKRLGCNKFDLWGVAASGYTDSDPWAGFTRFKEGFGGKRAEYVGAFDLVIDKKWYGIYKLADKFRGATRKLGMNI